MPPEIEVKQSSFPKPIIILVILAILIVAGLVYVGRKYGPSAPGPVEGPTGLTDAQKDEILKSLQLPPGTKPLTQAEKDEILKSLQLPPNTPPLTEAEKAEILKSLK